MYGVKTGIDWTTGATSNQKHHPRPLWLASGESGSFS
jgi:hypothetical protein